MPSDYDPHAWYRHKRGEIEKCTTSNYPRWQQDIKQLLKVLGIWTYVDGTAEAPTPPVEGASNALRNAYQTAKGTWDTNRAEAVFVLYNSCSDAVKVYIRDNDDPASIWRALNTNLNTLASNTGRSMTRRQFRKCKPAANETMSQWFSRLADIKHQLFRTESEITDDEHKEQILANLPSQYDVTAQMLELEANVTIDVITQRIKERELKLISTGEIAPRTKGSALAAQAKPGPVRTGKGRGNLVPSTPGHCKTHGWGGHLTSECFGGPQLKDRFNPYNKPKKDQPTATDENCSFCGKPGHAKNKCFKRQKVFKAIDEQAHAKVAAGEDVSDDQADAHVTTADPNKKNAASL